LYLLVTFRPPESLVKIQEDQFRYMETQATSDLTSDQLGYQGFCPMSGSPELNDIFKLIVRLR
jgi:hypothetical protein